tara:strand:- start:171 stop:314 length:144 start_codon:yes stop_codon:yes gene_type:complete
MRAEAEVLIMSLMLPVEITVLELMEELKAAEELETLAQPQAMTELTV